LIPGHIISSEAALVNVRHFRS